ncbi:MAG: chitobiase/beta-hexosaminidase C-terminal domain-containing protein, partial [Acidobacteriaceae bacterium]
MLNLLPPKAFFGLLYVVMISLTGCDAFPTADSGLLGLTATPSLITTIVSEAAVYLRSSTGYDLTRGHWSLPGQAPANTRTAASPRQWEPTASVPASFVHQAPAGPILLASALQLPAQFALSAATDNSRLTPSTSPRVTKQPTLAWNPPAPIAYGTRLGPAQLNATASVPGTFVYQPAAGLMLKPETYKLTATFTPADPNTYASASISVAITVKPAFPAIIWPTPAAIPAGTILSAKQLNAVASVPGKFAYRPWAGTTLTAGKNVLTVKFAPTDAVDYAQTTAQTTIVVNQAPSGPTGCGGPTINLNPGMSLSTLQSAIASAPQCALIAFAAGTYNIGGSLTIPCASNLTLAGPQAQPPTAILAQSAANTPIFSLSNCTGVTILYLQFANAMGIYVGQTDNANITLMHNLFTNLQGTQAVLLDGFLAPTVTNGVIHNIDSNVIVAYNSFGDAGSCTTEFASTQDLSGYCSGFQTKTGELLNLMILHNYFYHLEEPIHLVQDTTFNPGATNSVCVSCVIDYNYILNYHRIGVEIQQAIPNTGQGFEFNHNAVVDPLNPFYATFAVSLACCTGAGFVQGDNQSAMPGAITDDNLLISTQGPGIPPYAFEWWGDQATSNGSMIEGQFSNGFDYGYGSGPRTISNAYICGPDFTTNGGYIVSEGFAAAYAAPPIETNDVTSATCASKPSTAPAINQTSSGVTLTDSAPNTSIYYTTDGSTPTTSSTLYTGAFTASVGAHIKAIAMWGVAPQPTSYEAGYGYTPSSVVTATYTGAVVKALTAKVKSSQSTITEAAAESAVAGGATTTFPVQSVAITPSAAAVTIGGSTQLKAIATFTDGSAKDITSAFNWRTSDPRTVSANESGLVAGLASGESVISGSYDGHAAAAKVTSTMGDLDWGGSLVITQGGTYTGNWQSTDAKTPAVTIATTQPVVIENAHLRSAGDLIRTTIAGANITVRNSLGVAL